MFAYLQMRGQRVIRAGELTDPLRLTPAQERELFRRMVRGRLIARVRPGLFLAPARLPLGGAWSPGPALALETLMSDRGGRYQICGPAAFNHYGFDDQVATRVHAYNNRISGDRAIGTVALTLIKVSTDRLGDVEVATVDDGEQALFSSRARTLVDAVYDWSRFDTLPRAFDWIHRELSGGRVKAGELVRVTLRYGDIGTVRRIGALLDRLGTGVAVLAKLERALKPTTAAIPWVPTRPRRGRVDRRWGIIWNDRG